MQTTFRLSAFSTGELANFAEIVCLIGDRNYTYIYLKNGEAIFAAKNISLFEQILANSTDFVRIHKRHIVNLRYVSSITKARSGGYVRLFDGRKLTISRRRAGVIRKNIHEETDP